ncbi:MAG: hypothetical protein Q8O31_02800 [Rhodocyclaceae bacterium]|nr:hypothetical protein [Rhodocyclaceae bacterium]
MNCTRVDDMLIEMIGPRVKEIEEKFARGEGLESDDINTLLLKSQYNHINHLDSKLNEVVASVVTLERKFTELSGQFSTFKAEIIAELAKSQVEMRDMILTTMRWYIGSAGVVLVLLKALDLFVK